MIYEIVINSCTPQEYVQPIFLYWKNIGNSSTMESEENMHSIAKKYSYCVIKYPKCQLCHSPFTKKVFTELEFTTESCNEKNVCELCQKFSPNIGHKETYITDYKPKIEELTIDEYKVLRGIAELQTKYLVYKHIFNNNVKDLSIWDIVNSLQQKGLLSIERNNEWKVKKFRIEEHIKKFLK